jgi:pimeloyl-ACP methyl ester carboxylesterase
MQFAYQFPERTERLVLVAPGGFGPEVTPLIRAVTTPGFHQVAGLLTLPGVRRLSTGGLRVLAGLPVPHTRDLREVADVLETFADSRQRAAIRHVVRAVVDWKGQVITMTDRAYLTEHMPICVIWGADDMVIPVRHAETARQVAPGARIEVVPNAGHFPHKDHPQRFVKLLNDFVRSTRPSAYDVEGWRRTLRSGGNQALREAEAGERPIRAV